MDANKFIKGRANRQSCSNCFFFRKTDRAINEGECHRYAPRPTVPIESEVDDNAFWPDVKVSDWCGEWKARA